MTVRQLELLKNKIAIAGEELGGEAREKARELLSLVDADPFTDVQAEQEPRERSGAEQPPAQLWDRAHAAGFAGTMADLLAATDLEGHGTGKLRPRQAFFCGWYVLYRRAGGKEILRQAGLETTITGIAAWLNCTKPTVYKWMASDWWGRLGVESWINQGLMNIIPDALQRLHHNVAFGEPAVANTAIKTVFSVYKDQRQPAAGQQQAVQVINQLSGYRDELPAGDELSDDETSLLLENLVIAEQTGDN